MSPSELYVHVTKCRNIDELCAFLNASSTQLVAFCFGSKENIAKWWIELDQMVVDFADLPVFISFKNAFQSGTLAKNEIYGLLLLLHAVLTRNQSTFFLDNVIELMPRKSPVRLRAEAHVLSKNVDDVTTGYKNCIDIVLQKLVLAQETEAESSQLCCDILVDFVLSARFAFHRLALKAKKYAVLETEFKEALLTSVHAPSLFSQKGFASLFEINGDQLGNHIEETRSRIVEALFDDARELIVFRADALDVLFNEVRRHVTPTHVPLEMSTILQNMGAFYSPDPLLVQVGVDADDKRNLAYLGTYFPRSFCEWRTFWGELLCKTCAGKEFVTKDVVSIVSLGSGTGGDIAGTLYALVEAGIRPRQINVYSFDVNQDALAKQEMILKKAAEELGLNVGLFLRQHEWGRSPDEFRHSCENVSALIPQYVDIVQVSKCLVEVYNRNSSVKGIVSAFLSFADRILSEKGLIGILDVTTKGKLEEFFSIIVNREAISYLGQSDSSLWAVSPIPCALVQHGCGEQNCFTQRRFCISSCFCSYDVSKVCWRVFAKKTFAHSIISSFSRQAYTVSAGRLPVCHNGKRVNLLGSPCGFSSYQIH